MKYYAIQGCPKNDEEAIALCADKLFQEGCVTDQFSDNCIKRERLYPTGMPSQLPVAMPHSESSGVIEDAICLLILEKPVDFRRIDDDEQQIHAQMVFNLAVKDPARHMAVLQNLMKMFYDTETLKTLYNSPLNTLPGQLAALLDVKVNG
ncbi:MAG: PTS sugar transporter subunit IIA [Erysipelotrichaceae bacterium]|jgi:PTS system galactitol-specific IIA component|nr:PTS sugar transporter subunit IIA [Erysipelotrichaceae bacterium]